MSFLLDEDNIPCNIIFGCMHAYLMVGKGREVILKAYDLAKKFSKETYEFSLQKIEDARELSKFLKFSFNSPTSILINDIDKATTETLNAFLKNLEEPPKNINYLLTAVSESKVLPTITSRCQVIRVSNQQSVINNQPFSQFLEKRVSEKLLIIDRIKDRQEAITFIQNVISTAHTQLTKEEKDPLKLSAILETSQKTLDALNSNGNVSLQLTNYIANLEFTEG